LLQFLVEYITCQNCTVQKFDICEFINIIILKEVSFARQGCIYVVRNTVKSVILKKK